MNIKCSEKEFVEKLRRGEATILPRSYKDFLETDYWKNLKTNVVKRFSDKCVLCNQKAVLAHHRSYQKRGKDGEINDLVALYWHCHELFHEKHKYNQEKHIHEKD